MRDVLYGAWCSGKLIGGGTVPPLSILSVATVARAAGLEAGFLDALGEGLSLEETLARGQGYDVVVVLTSSMTFAEDLQVLEQLQGANPHLRAVLFGAQPTFLPEYCLRREVVTALVMREPEYAIRDLLLAWQNSAPWQDIPGVAYRTDQGPVVNPPYPFINNLDELPFPDRSLLPPGVAYYNPLIKKYPYISMLTSRGCPSKCTYCTAPYFMGGRLRMRSAASVVEELLFVAQQGYRTVYFRDETFCAFRKRNLEICEALLSRDVRLRWIANAIPGELDREYLLLMKRAGLSFLKFGVETGNQEILNRVNKGIDLEMVRRDLALCRALGVETHAHLMLGMPGETRETIQKTFRFIEENEPTTVTYSVCSPYPGTPLFEEVREKNPEVAESSLDDLALQNLHVSSQYNQVFTALTNEEIEAAVQEGYRRFYLRPGYILRSLLRVRTLHELLSLCRAGLNVLAYSVSGRK
ncbi:MAG: radical SAM protein [Deltaproteobacteria bacterium]|nr:radical SAM protein [Deltaproteobacteria bacterium]